MSHRRQMLDPGPLDPSVLHAQVEHRSTDIWESPVRFEEVIRVRTMMTALRQILDPPQDARVLQQLHRAGFYGIYKLGAIHLYWPLLTSLVERWRRETHTFHLPIGEATITLQDMEVISGLRVDGEPVTGIDEQRGLPGRQTLCQELLGRTLNSTDFKRGRLKITWLTEHFLVLPEEATDADIQCHARALILIIIGAQLLPDHSGNLVKLHYLTLLRDLDACGQLAWGAAGLACLYREMCSASTTRTAEMAGPISILQVWIWERLAQFRPVITRPPPPLNPAPEEFSLPADPWGCRWKGELALSFARPLRDCREQLTLMREDQMTWCPYPDSVLSTLPHYCRAGVRVWHSTCPLICYEIVEYHLPGRVMRQFSLRQVIPPEFDTDAHLHELTRRGRGEVNWLQYHQPYIEEWGRRRESVVQGQVLTGRLPYDDPYMDWYRQITRIHIAPPSHVPPIGSQPVAADISILVNALVRIHELTVEAIASAGQFGYLDALQQIIQQTGPVMTAIDYEERVRGFTSSTQAGSSSQAEQLHRSRLRPIGRRALRHPTVYGPELKHDLSLPPVPDSDVPSSSISPTSTSSRIHEVHISSSVPIAEQRSSETHIPVSDPHVELQTPPAAIEACATLSADIDDFWSGILHIEPFFTSPASESHAVAFDTEQSMTAPHAPVKAYTRRPRARGTGMSSSIGGADQHIPMVLPMYEISTARANEPHIHEPQTEDARVDDTSVEAAVEAYVEDASAGEPRVEEAPLAVADDVPLRLHRPRRIVKRLRCGTE